MEIINKINRFINVDHKINLDRQLHIYKSAYSLLKKQSYNNDNEEYYCTIEYCLLYSCSDKEISSINKIYIYFLKTKLFKLFNSNLLSDVNERFRWKWNFNKKGYKQRLNFLLCIIIIIQLKKILKNWSGNKK